MDFLICTIISLVCLLIFLIFIFIGKESLFTYFVVFSSMVVIMCSVSVIIILVGKGLTPWMRF